MTTTLAQAFPPGEFLAEELDAHGWTQADLADVIGRPAQLVSGIITGKKQITRETASELAAALGGSADYWLNLQNTYELWLAEQDPAAKARLDAVRRRAHMNELAPVAALRKAGRLPNGPLDEQEKALCALLRIETIDDTPPFDAAARRHNEDEPVTAGQRAWLACARQDAARADAAPFSRSGLEELAHRLTRTITSPSDVERLPAMLAEVGVRLVYVPALPGSRISGASFLLDGDDEKPCIALSGLGKRFDKVLFTLMHEMAHLVRGDVTAGTIFVDEGEDGWDDIEKATNNLAASWCLPVPFTPPVNIRRPWVDAEAARQGVHPLIIIGRLQHMGKLDWKTELVRGAAKVDEHLAAWQASRTPGRHCETTVAAFNTHSRSEY